jgi:uncharacterized membrane-anchored protein YjiN (DUF445 family)
MEQKRERILKALQRIDNKDFVKNCLTLLNSEKNFEKIWNDIVQYRISKYSQNQQFKKYLFDSIEKFDKNWLFVTLTFKFDVQTLHAKKQFESFIENTSKTVFKHAYSRYNKRLSHLTVCAGLGGVGAIKTEKNDGVAVHFHSIIKIPELMNDESFSKLIIENWKNGRCDIGSDNSNSAAAVQYLINNTKSNSKILLSDNFII